MAHKHNALILSDSDDEIVKTQATILSRDKPIHEILGGGKGTITSAWLLPVHFIL